MSPTFAAVLLATAAVAGAERAAPAPSRGSAPDLCGAAGIPADRCTRWQPGIPGGIPRRTKICATVDAAAFGDGKADATGAIQGAISACPEGSVVQLPSGTYRITEGLLLNKGVVLRGAGPASTKIRLDTRHDVPAIFVTNLWPEYYREPVDVTADVPKGSLSIPVARTADFAVGDIIQIDQLDDPSYVHHGGCRWMKRGPNRSDDRRPVSPDGYRAQGQTVEVVAISGGALAISTPIHLGFKLASRPQVFKPTGPMTPSGPTVKHAGVEDLYVTGGRNGMIMVINAAYSWIKNVESDGNPATGAGLKGTHFSLASCFRCVVRDSFLHDATEVVQGGGAYGLSILAQSSDCLVENNVIFNLNKPLVTQASGGGNVIAYNYIDDAWTGAMASLQETTIDGGHASFPHMELFEGNWAAHMGTDSVWGNSGWLTFFRNYASSQQHRTPIIPETYDVAAVGLEGKAHFMTVVGNVLGAPGKGLVYEVHSNPPGTGKPAVYRIGHRANGSGGGGDSNLYEDPTRPGTTGHTLLRHGNFDYATNSVVWAPNVSSRRLPPSLYLTERPAFFGTLPWPWVEPEGATKVHVLPAKQRFDGARQAKRAP